jgi:hypothetical protein
LVYAAPLALVGLLAVAPSLYAADGDTAGTDPAQRVAPLPRTTPVRDPAAALAKHLNLDANQLAQVRRLLAIQKVQIRKVWSDPSIDPDDRVGAVKAINAKTIGQIRALLTEEQKQKYFQPLPAGSLPAEGGPGVADWLHALRPQAETTGATH